MSGSMLIAAGKITELAEAGKSVLDHKRELLNSHRTFWRWLKHRGHEIVIVGPGGTGKSTLGQMLGGTQFFDPHLSVFNESPDVEEFKRAGEGVFKIRVVPGQKRRREQVWPKIAAGLAEGKTVGIINVASYGYHTFRQARIEDITSVYKPNMSTSAFLAAYLADRRQEELEIVQELVQPMTTLHPNLWMMTLVTKQDLWWADSAAISDYYEQGAYNGFIEEIVKRRGQVNFPHEYHASSLIMNNLRSGDGKVLAATTQGYDQTIQYAYWKRFLDALNALAERTG